ncbi:hypothetical protein [Phenylobacterium sp.]|uniref:hypothetical protein n=1 Tax=Phenylobacterium sp. TaxID=1871053 RepID=UPI0025CEF38E|nr:hypothetical protein [Phenylobacterium sp.]
MFPSRFPRPVRLGLYGLATAILLVLCVLPTRDLPDPGTGDKFEHAVSWFILTLTGYVLAPNRRLAIPLFAVGFGAVIEVLQANMGLGRHGDWADLATDCVGVATAVLLFLAVQWVSRQRRQPA